MSPRSSSRRRSCLLPLVLGLIFLVLVFVISDTIIPSAASDMFGSANSKLSKWQRFRYGVELLWDASELTNPLNTSNEEILFIIQPGEDAFQVSTHLEKASLIRSARTFQVYLAWSGKDAYLQPGTFRLNSSLTALAIADLIQTAGATDISLTILPGWRIEEIADTLPTSGLDISNEEFISTAYSFDLYSDLIPEGKSTEGFLFPGTYSLPRTTTVIQLISHLVDEFRAHLPAEYVTACSEHGINLHQAVSLASIIQKEAVQEIEMPTIASVFYNRLAVGMNLQTDPTVQYALGYDLEQGSWWKTPLSYTDLAFDSLYNTYIYSGLPPGPISNPGLAALTAVVYPTDTPYFYFQAKCDGSGYHNFAITLEEHIGNNCP